MRAYAALPNLASAHEQGSECVSRPYVLAMHNDDLRQDNPVLVFHGITDYGECRNEAVPATLS